MILKNFEKWYSSVNSGEKCGPCMFDPKSINCEVECHQCPKMEEMKPILYCAYLSGVKYKKNLNPQESEL